MDTNTFQATLSTTELSCRDLDKAIAEKVFGWTYIGEHFEDSGVPPGAFVPFRVPHYSTDIAAAWLIVEEMRNTRGGHGRVELYYGSDDWRCTIWHSHGDPVETYDATAPRAIGHAALAVAALTPSPSASAPTSL